MQDKQTKEPNLQVDESKAFTKKLKEVDQTYTNKLIARVRVNVPEEDDYRVSRFDIGAEALDSPLLCKVQFDNSRKIFKTMRPIRVPKYTPYQIHITPFYDELPFVETPYTKPLGELHYRNKTLKPLSEMPKIDPDFNDKIKLTKW